MLGPKSLIHKDRVHDLWDGMTLVETLIPVAGGEFHGVHNLLLLLNIV